MPKVHTAEFRDAQALAAASPDTFNAPSQEELDSVGVGTLVKVCAGGERFWVEVVRKRGTWLVGRVKNKVLAQKFAYGDLVRFDAKHIYDIDNE